MSDTVPLTRRERRLRRALFATSAAATLMAIVVGAVIVSWVRYILPNQPDPLTRGPYLVQIGTTRATLRWQIPGSRPVEIVAALAAALRGWPIVMMYGLAPPWGLLAVACGLLVSGIIPRGDGTRPRWMHAGPCAGADRKHIPNVTDSGRKLRVPGHRSRIRPSALAHRDGRSIARGVASRNRRRGHGRPRYSASGEPQRDNRV